MEAEQIRNFLIALGERYPQSAQLYLLGGSALCLLGSPRPTIDIDYVGDDIKKDALQKTMEVIARGMDLEVEAVPIEKFIPASVSRRKNNIRVGKFGKIEVFIFDPYSIALSKVDRGFDTDLDDVVFLVKRGIVNMDALEPLTHVILSQSHEYDLDPKEFLEHLQELKSRLS